LNKSPPPPSHTLRRKVKISFNMKSQIYGIIGIALGLLAILAGLGEKSGQRSDLAGILVIGGIFIFGCGLVAAAIGARK
jgi:hypothetical protein